MNSRRVRNLERTLAAMDPKEILARRADPDPTEAQILARRADGLDLMRRYPPVSVGGGKVDLTPCVLGLAAELGLDPEEALIMAAQTLLRAPGGRP